MKDNLPDKMLMLMEDGEWHSAIELSESISHRFSATKHTLEKRGYKFRKRHVRAQEYEYQLIITERTKA